MRCSCHVCDTYMVHSEGPELGCVCPECGYRCKACLGTDSVLSRDALSHLKEDAALVENLLSAFDHPDPPAWEDAWEDDLPEDDGSGDTLD